MSQIGTWFKKYSLVLVWLVFLLWMCHDYWIAYPPKLGDGHGHNRDGELYQNAVFSVLEVCVLYAILRPWSASVRSLKRFLAAFGLFFPWLCFFLLLTMHAGNVSMIHALWLACINMSLIVAILTSIVVIDLSA
ncbi:MAG TPA: hypothetical protein V6C98_06220 [Thermosynechococcaceae cyanobacterium]|jgi:hypothetical protein